MLQPTLTRGLVAALDGILQPETLGRKLERIVEGQVSSPFPQFDRQGAAERARLAADRLHALADEIDDWDTPADRKVQLAERVDKVLAELEGLRDFNRERFAIIRTIAFVAETRLPAVLAALSQTGPRAPLIAGFFAGWLDPSMEGDVKTHSTQPPGQIVLASGVRLQSRHAGPGDRSPDRTVALEAAGDSSRHSVLLDSVGDHHSLDTEAVLFSRISGNHPSIRASVCHGFIRFSGGA